MPAPESPDDRAASAPSDPGRLAGPKAPADDPDDRPSARREYHGARTMVVALLVVGTVAGALFLALGTRDRASVDAESLGIVEIPSFLITDDRDSGREAGQRALDFELDTLDGGRFRLTDWRGHPILLNFWASWCVPCRREAPVLVRLYEQYRSDGFLVVGVNIEETRGAAQTFVDEFGIPFVVPMDFSGEVTRAYLRVGPPNSYFIRPDGVIQQVYLGQAPDDVFEAGVADLMATLTKPIGPLQAPGPKALPVPLQGGERMAGAEEGRLAPDFVLAPAEAPGDRWRLSDQRGAALVLIFIPPSCGACDDAVDALLDQTAATGRVVFIGDGPAGRAAVRLEWNADLGKVYGAGTRPRRVAIDAAGRVQTVADARDPLRP